MELSFSSKDLEFRDEVRNFLANEYPKHVKEKTDNGEPLTKEDIVDWHKSFLQKAGWALTGLKSMVVLDGHQRKFTYFKMN